MFALYSYKQLKTEEHMREHGSKNNVEEIPRTPGMNIYKIKDQENFVLVTSISHEAEHITAWDDVKNLGEVEKWWGIAHPKYSEPIVFPKEMLDNVKLGRLSPEQYRDCKQAGEELIENNKNSGQMYKKSI